MAHSSPATHHDGKEAAVATPGKKPPGLGIRIGDTVPMGWNG